MPALCLAVSGWVGLGGVSFAAPAPGWTASFATQGQVRAMIVDGEAGECTGSTCTFASSVKSPTVHVIVDYDPQYWWDPSVTSGVCGRNPPKSLTVLVVTPEAGARHVEADAVLTVSGPGRCELPSMHVPATEVEATVYPAGSGTVQASVRDHADTAEPSAFTSVPARFSALDDLFLRALPSDEWAFGGWSGGAGCAGNDARLHLGPWLSGLTGTAGPGTKPNVLFTPMPSPLKCTAVFYAKKTP